MATSGTYSFNPVLGELVLYAFQCIGIRPTALLQEHMESARLASNMALARWANQGVNLWAVDLVETPIVNGQSTYDVDPSTVVILDAYVVSNNIDRIITPVSRTEYASFPNKDQAGFPTCFWNDRLISPTISLWPVPDESSQVTSLKYYRLRQIQDANLTNGQNVEIPYLWMEAFADALAFRLGKIWPPTNGVSVAELKLQADESYNIASSRNTESVPMFISPQLSGYFRG